MGKFLLNKGGFEQCAHYAKPVYLRQGDYLAGRRWVDDCLPVTQTYQIGNSPLLHFQARVGYTIYLYADIRRNVVRTQAEGAPR